MIIDYQIIKMDLRLLLFIEVDEYDDNLDEIIFDREVSMYLFLNGYPINFKFLGSDIDHDACSKIVEVKEFSNSYKPGIRKWKYYLDKKESAYKYLPEISFTKYNGSLWINSQYQSYNSFLKKYGYWNKKYVLFKY